MQQVSIREELSGDFLEIRYLLERCFERSGEADVVDRLRMDCPERLSLVAEQHGQAVGYCLLTPTVIEAPAGRVDGMAISPLAVLPRLQGKGIGTSLVQTALERLRQRAGPYALAVGAPGYYARFGFRPVRLYDVRSEYPGAPDDALMLLALDVRRLMGVSGLARLRPELAAALKTRP
jgi:putative acetyltransferase